MSASSGPYKSRLFSFINRQFLHVSTQLAKTVRHVRVTAEWSVQTLLYPVYLLVQSGRTVANRLNQTSAVHQASMASSKAASTSADRPIAQVLEVAQPLLAAVAVPGALRHKRERQGICAKIQGVATLLETRELVLVVEGNHLVNILSQQQQHQLRQRIIWEVANYWYARRSLAVKTSQLPAFKKGNAKVVAPVRFFWNVMHWVQSSPMAIALNFFGESRLVRSRFQASQPAPPKSSAALDRPSNRLKSQLVSVHHREQLGQSADTVMPIDLTRRVRSLIRAAVDYFFGDRLQGRWFLPNRQPQPQITGTAALSFQTHPSKLASASGTPQMTIASAADTIAQTIKGLKLRPPFQWPLNQAAIELEPDPFDLRILIRSAVDYFFGRQQAALGGRLEQPTDNILGSTPAFSQIPSQPLSTSWLVWEDLFAETTPATQQTQQPEAPSLVDSGTVLNRLTSDVEGFVPVNSRLLGAGSSPAATAQTTVRSAFANQNSAPVSRSAQPTTLKPSPDWIETNATGLGYIKHPLERALAWLDRMMLWLEEFIVGMWHRLQRVLLKTH